MEKQSNFETIPVTFPNPLINQEKLVSQCCGTSISIFFAFLYFTTFLIEITGALTPNSPTFTLIKSASALSTALYFYFFVQMIRVPEFLAGKPKLNRFWAPAVNFCISLAVDVVVNLREPFQDLLNEIFLDTFIFILCLGIYSQDDASESCCLCFKPWIYKKTPMDLVYVQTSTPLAPPAYPTVPFTYPGYNSQNQFNQKTLF